MKYTFLKNLVLGAAAILMAASTLPVTTVFAQEGTQPKRQITSEKLEQVWSRQLNRYEKISKLFSNSDAIVEKIQTRLDQAKANGKDVSAVQTALDAFKAALKNAKPIYQSMNGIVTSHQGFDSSGKVTDQTKALETIKQMHQKMEDLKTAMNGSGRALHEAIRAFREANKPAATP